MQITSDVVVAVALATNAVVAAVAQATNAVVVAVAQAKSEGMLNRTMKIGM